MIFRHFSWNFCSIKNPIFLYFFTHTGLSWPKKMFFLFTGGSKKHWKAWKYVFIIFQKQQIFIKFLENFDKNQKNTFLRLPVFSWAFCEIQKRFFGTGLGYKCARNVTESLSRYQDKGFWQKNQYSSFFQFFQVLRTTLHVI